jgi:hypothetical protein
MVTEDELLAFKEDALRALATTTDASFILLVVAPPSSDECFTGIHV